MVLPAFRLLSGKDGNSKGGHWWASRPGHFVHWPLGFPYTFGGWGGHISETCIRGHFKEIRPPQLM